MNTDRWLIHRHFAQTTDERLELVRKVPQHILLAGADADISRSLLAARYPKATFSEYDSRADFLEAANARRKNGFWTRVSGKAIPQHHQNMTAPLPEACADFLWANLSLITEPDFPPVLLNWAQALKPHGLLFFTHFGIDSLQSLCAYLKTHGIETKSSALIDMHDLGDMLLENGFYDPITDTAKLELSYNRPVSFWQDMETLGLSNAISFSDPKAARCLIEQAIETGGFSITLETIYAHAVKKAVLPTGTSPVQFYPHSQSK